MLNLYNRFYLHIGKSSTPGKSQVSQKFNFEKRCKMLKITSLKESRTRGDLIQIVVSLEEVTLFT